MPKLTLRIAAFFGGELKFSETWTFMRHPPGGNQDQP
jgi:hypothetical protein